MDFKAMIRPVRFGGKATPEEAGVPAPLCRQQSGTRRLAALREAKEVLAVMPGPGASLHAIMTGRYDLADLIDAAMGKLGTIDHLRIATLSFNGRNVDCMASWLESRRVVRLTMLCSRFFYEHNPGLFDRLRDVLQKHGQDNRIAASRNHCKVVCLHCVDGQRLAMEGSANLRTNSNREQFTMIHDATLHDWHAAWITEQVLKHEGDTNDNPAAG